jgi:hypothetical protein
MYVKVMPSTLPQRTAPGSAYMLKALSAAALSSRVLFNTNGIATG